MNVKYEILSTGNHIAYSLKRKAFKRDYKKLFKRKAKWLEHGRRELLRVKNFFANPVPRNYEIL
ncbi:MAG: hypothetical protein J6Y02_04690 [Pseudobutyrivibrio sp.]|nr:hypothetical protein [Pseudobutyrivibrio sp.]